MTRRRRLAILFLVLALAGLAAAIWLGSVVRGREFEPEAWRADLDAHEGTRLGMARRLIWDKSLDGKSRADVVAMLGEPQPPGSLGPDHMVYWLNVRGNRSDWLVLRLGPDGRVSECRIDRE